MIASNFLPSQQKFIDYQNNLSNKPSNQAPLSAQKLIPDNPNKTVVILGYREKVLFEYLKKAFLWASALLIGSHKFIWLEHSKILEDLKASFPNQLALRRSICALRKAQLIEAKKHQNKRFFRLLALNYEQLSNLPISNSESDKTEAEAIPDSLLPSGVVKNMKSELNIQQQLFLLLEEIKKRDKKIDHLGEKIDYLLSQIEQKNEQSHPKFSPNFVQFSNLQSNFCSKNVRFLFKTCPVFVQNLSNFLKYSLYYNIYINNLYKYTHTNVCVAQALHAPSKIEQFAKNDCSEIGPSKNGTSDLVNSENENLDFANSENQKVKNQTSTSQKNKTSATKKAPKVKTILSAVELIADGADEDLARQYIDLRKSKRAPLTLLAWKKFKDEVAKLQAEAPSFTINKALELCLINAWQGFDASWEKARLAAGLNNNPQFNQAYQAKKAGKAKKQLEPSENIHYQDDTNDRTFAIVNRLPED